MKPAVERNAIASRPMAIVLTCALVAACTTTSNSPQASKDMDGHGAPFAATVQQAGRTTPVYAEKDRSYYVDLRQSKATLARIDGSLATGESAAAVDMARAHLAQQPGNVHALTALAAALTMTRQYELANYYATLAERAQPGNAAAINVKAIALMLRPSARIGDFQKAEALFRQAFDSDQNQIASGLNLGNLLLEMGNSKASAEVFQQTANRCGQCTAATMGLGVARSRSRDFGGAALAFQQILDKNPRHPEALYHLALVYKNGYNKSKEAETYLQALLKDESAGDLAMRERAQTVLRAMRGEASVGERQYAQDDDKGQESAGSDQSDAELLMISSEFNEP